VGCEVNEQSGERLIGVVERQFVGFPMGFPRSIAWICDHFKSGLWVPSQHLGIGFITSPGGC